MNTIAFRKTLAEWLLMHSQHFDFVEEAVDDSELFFKRHMPDGSQALKVAVWDRCPFIKFCCLISVRLDRVEAIYHLFSGSRPTSHAMSSTIVTSLNYFVGGPAENVISKSEELIDLLSSWDEPMRTEVIPYLAFATDIKSLDRLINSVPMEVLDITRTPYSLMHHIILAKLAHNANFDQLVDSHREELRDLHCDGSSYEHLVDHLRHCNLDGI
jgi:hypothetical protein